MADLTSINESQLSIIEGIDKINENIVQTSEDRLDIEREILKINQANLKALGEGYKKWESIRRKMTESQKVNRDLHKTSHDIGREQIKNLETLNETSKEGLDVNKEMLEVFKNMEKERKKAIDDEKNITEEKEKQEKLDRESEKHDKKRQEANEKLKQGVKGLFGPVLGLGKEAFGLWEGVDKSLLGTRKTFAHTQEEYYKYRQRHVELASKYRHYGFELNEFEANLANATGRAREMRNSEFESVQEIMTLTSLGVDGTVELANNMDKFGVTVENSATYMRKLVNESKAHGISAEKTAKIFSENMDLMNTFTFSKGIDGLQSMVLKSEKLRLNLKDVASFAEQVSNPEGAIETAAKLQVLGGSFARMADPIQMLHGSLTDLDSLSDQYTKMLNNVAKVDKTTGEVTIGGYDRMRMKEAAKAMGVDFNSMMETTRTKARRDSIDNVLDSGIKGGIRENIISKATMGKNGWEVDGKRLSEITAGDKAILDQYKTSEMREKELNNHMLTISEHVKAIKEGTQLSLVGGFNKMTKALDLANELTADDSKRTIEEDKGSIIGLIANGVTAVPSLMMIANGLLGNIWMSLEKRNGLGSTRGLLGTPSSGMAKFGGKILKHGGKIGAAGGIIAGGVDVYNARKAHKAGDITDDQLTQEYVGAGAGVAGAIAGTKAGAAIGSLILPGIGTAIGAAIGGTGGYLIGNWGGKGVTKMIQGEPDKADDLIIPSGGGKPIKLHSQDQIIAAKPNGAIDKYFKSAKEGNSTVNGGMVSVAPITINGNIRLESSGKSVDLTELMNDAEFKREMAKMIAREFNKNTNGGRMNTNPLK